MATEQKATTKHIQLGRGEYVRLTSVQSHAVEAMLARLSKQNPDISMTRSDAIRHLLSLGMKSAKGLTK